MLPHEYRNESPESKLSCGTRRASQGRGSSLTFGQNMKEPSRFPSSDETPARRAIREQSQAIWREVMHGFRDISHEISALLFATDPLNLNIGPNLSEYDNEARAILANLFRCQSEEDVLTFVYRAFCDRAGQERAGAKSRFSKVAGQIWALWRERI